MEGGSNLNFVQQNLDMINQRIEAACQRVSRSPAEIQLIAVTKYASIARMEEAYQVGLKAFGENRLQDALPKIEAFKGRVTWHFIGTLQTNKVKEVLSHFDYIHSLDRIKLADEMARQAERLKIRPKCFIQVNVSGEKSKHGVEVERLFDLAKGISETGAIDVVGLMTMAPYLENREEIRPIFRRLKELQIQLLEKAWPGISPHSLSMGMSNDYEVAIEEGATHIRLGTALVGNDLKNDH
jgi:pyridoxal phosphate enzyme (YggS family)